MELQGNGMEMSRQVDAEVERELAAALGGKSVEQFMQEVATPAAPAADDKAGAADSKAEKAAGDPGRFEFQVRRGRIVQVQEEDVFVELAGMEGKHQAVVPLKQFDRAPRLGSIMEFVIERVDDAEGLIILSREGAASRATWDNLQKGSIVEARVVGTNKGGLELELIGGIRAFMPASQIDFHHVENLEEQVGQKYTAIVQDVDRKSKRVVISRRLYLEQDKKAKERKVWEELEVGQMRDGKVSSLVEYGAFIDLGGVDGLIHISDLSYKRVSKPDEVVKVGQLVKVKVLKLDKEKQRISLGLKQVDPDPWEKIGDRIKIGDLISSRVVRIADFGAFVEVETGVEGLLPASEITWKRVAKPTAALKEGDIVKLMVLSIDVEKHRVTLSLKQSAGDPWIGAAARYPKHSLVEAKVLSTTDFGAFVEIAEGLEGLVHISELSDKRVNAVEDVLKPSEMHQFRILEVDETARRIRLSLKAAKEAAPVEVVATPAKAAAKPGRPRHISGKGGLGANPSLGLSLKDLKL